MDMFFNEDHRRMKLEGCIFLHKETNLPVYITNSGGKMVTLSFLHSKEKIRRKWTDDLLILKSLPLGNMNTHIGVVRSYRYPCRRAKLGVHRENTYGNKIGGGLNYCPFDFIDSLHNTIVGNYMTLDQAVDLGEGAYDRDWCYIQGGIYYKNMFVGNLTDGGVTLHKTYSFLMECAGEVHESVKGV